MSEVPKIGSWEYFCKVLQLLLCSFVMQNIQIFYGGPAMFIVTCFLAQQTRNFLPEHLNIIIKQQLFGRGSHLCCLCFRLMFFNAHQASQKSFISGLVIQIISPKVLQEDTTIPQLKVYIHIYCLCDE